MKTRPLAPLAAFLIAAFASLHAHAQTASATFHPSLLESLSASHSYSGKSGYKHNETSGETSVNNFSLSASGRLALGKATFLGFGAAFSINEIDSDDSVPAPERLGTITVNAGITQVFSEKWRGAIFARPGYYGDFEHYTWRTINVPVMAIANYTQSNGTRWSFGVSVNPFGEYKVMPVVSMRCALAEDWSLNLGFPRVGVMWQATKALELGLGATMQGGGYRTTKAPGKTNRADLANTYVNYREIRAGVNASYKVARRVSLSLEAGWMVDRRFDYHDIDYELKGKSSAYITAGVNIKM
ncbi:hypothetical protein M2103_002280 [Ereboglobus sp. PH5-5]|uniref:DUF6268 family outer membrane beta-barrel protein n=1 Tax=Ereboglobus sp. PH5-5 TaxID=2940529 RepID=UPI0024061736|nr:DUF6268 family outer membrane beta-barrel protein [Ereboglobus sp. PH5-5]MDF9834045.1 hypothetical protein [Ereboglobus sp. PH5-5]